MPLPSGIATRTLTVSTAVSGSTRTASVEVKITPSKSTLVWQPSGEPVSAFFQTTRTVPGQSAIIELPVVDQPGFVDENQLPVSDWSYAITVRYLFDGRKMGQTVTKHVAPSSSSPAVLDFDLLESGTEPLNRGPAGQKGDSAYDIAVKNGFSGSEEAWLASLSTGGVTPYTSWEQSTPATVWEVKHNLGYNPGGVAVTDSTGRKIWADVYYVDKNTLRINMSAAMSGTVHLS